jgi:hypothetical protein
MTKRQPPERWGRREVLKLGAIGIGAGVPVVMTLLPKEARAEGSWQCLPGEQAGAQGSWQCRGGAKGSDWRSRARDEENRDMFRAERDKRSEWTFPGGHEWRMRRLEEAEQRRRENGEFDRFGSDDDWR